MPDPPGSGPGGAVRLAILGPLRITRGGAEVDAGPRRQRSLLAVLLASPGRPLVMSELVTLLWGGDAPPTAVNIIHKYVGALRRRLEPHLPSRAAGSFLLRDGSGYRLVADAGSLDLLAFRDRLTAARDAVAAGDPAAALDRYAEALAVWRGPAGDGLASAPDARAAFAALDRELFDEVVTAAGIAIERGQPSRVLGAVRLAASMNRLGEPVHAALMLVLAAAGDRTGALEVYRDLRERLRAEAGLDPGPELREAHRRILTPDLPVRETAPPADRPAGLPRDLAFFAGRDAELDTLRRMVGDPADGRTGPLVVAMDGVAGVGKSALAVHFAHLAAADFPDGRVYRDLRGPGGPQPAGLLAALGVAAPDIPADPDAQTGAYRRLTAAKRILLLLDNVHDAGQVRPLLPASAGSLVLVTSRRPLIGLAARDGARLLRVEPPDPLRARELLRRRVAAHDTAENQAMETILDRCGRLPLALALLAARLGARPDLTLAQVAAELPDGASGDPLPAFLWSYRRLSPGAAGLFRLLGPAPAGGVTLEACAALSGQSRAATRAQLDELIDAAMLTDDGRGRASANPLTVKWASLAFLPDKRSDDRNAGGRGQR